MKKFSMVFALIFSFFPYSSVVFANEVVDEGFDYVSYLYRTEGEGHLMTYNETAAFCMEDGDNFWIPEIEILKKVIWAADLGSLNRWFWSSSSVSGEDCPEDSCHYQVHTKKLEVRVGMDEERSASGICVNY